MSGVPIDNTAIAIINSDTGYTPSNSILSSTLATNNNINELENTVTDTFGNIVHDGSIEYVETQEDRDARAYWASLMEQANEPSLLTLEDKYAFTVDWGDGSEPQEFISLEETPDVWYHEYTKPGTYTVAINGVFKRFYSYEGWSGNLIVDGEYVYDRDGVIVSQKENYATQSYMTKVIAWGNTQLESCTSCCCRSIKLKSIPMYDTTNSFNKVTSFESAWYDSSLPSIPYDSNTGNGLFSNMNELTDCYRIFQYCNFKEEIPSLLFSNCAKLSSLGYAFSECSISGELPETMFSLLPSLTNITNIFSDVEFEKAELKSTTFDNCKNLTNISLSFKGSSILGELPSGLFKNNNLIKDAYSAFDGFTKITSVGKDLLSGLISDDIQIQLFLAGTLIETIPDGFFLNLTGNNVWAPRFCSSCEKLKNIPSDLFDEISHFKMCCGMFGNCTTLTSSCPSYPSNGDFNSYETLQKYLGIFAKCKSMTDFNAIPKELGGEGTRLFPKYHVGMICLNDGSFIEIKDFVYDPGNKPIGFCVYSDDEINTIVAFNERSGNIGSGSSINSLFYKEGCPLPKYPNNSYMMRINEVFDFEYPKTAEEYTREFFAWSGYTENKQNLPGYAFIEDYQTGENGWFWRLPNPKELIYAWGLQWWIDSACEKIIEESYGDYTVSNCYRPGRAMFSFDTIWNNGVYKIETFGNWSSSGLLSANGGAVRPFCTIPQS